VEVRLYAEDAYGGFLPQTGRVLAWRPAEGPGLRCDHGMHQGQAISPFYDPMIAKLVAHAPTRAEACRKLARALEDTVILGPTTNRHFLVTMLRHPAFIAGQATTSFIGKHFPTPVAPVAGTAHWSIAAALLWQQKASASRALLRGWRNSNPIASPMILGAGDQHHKLRLEMLDSDTVRVHTDGAVHEVALQPAEQISRVVGVDGVQRRVQCLFDGEALLLDVDALTLRFVDLTLAAPRAASEGGDGRLLAPMDGRVVGIRVAQGEPVSKGQVLVVLEAMKIQHQLKIGIDGTVSSVTVKEGDQVSGRTVLLTVDPSAP
jgi:geranyl-CoA carboxylase alpha subunit